MNKDRNSPQFGISIDPSAADPAEPFRRAKIADEAGIDLISLMDHPYNNRLFDTWTLLTALAAKTERVQLMTNVVNLPLRPPAMLAKMAATLDVISNGRLQLGLGAGAFWDGIVAFGGSRRKPGEAYQGFKEALNIIKGLWAQPGESFTYEGEIYQVRGAKLGPTPAHPIPIWVGAYGPRMLRLLGKEANGLIISRNYQPPENLPGLNRLIDDGAQEAGRSPHEIRRGYNLMGVLKTGHPENDIAGLKEGYINGTPQDWVESLAHWYQEYRQDTFIFWPIAGDQRSQIEIFAKEVVPTLKESLS